MKKILRLFSVQFLGLLSDTISIGRSNKKRPKKVYGLLSLFFIGMGVLVYFYAYGIGTLLLMFDAIEILPSMFMTLASLIALITTFHKVKGTLFAFRDYDLVMALPIKESHIVSSRLLLLYGLNIAFTFMIMIPSMIAYGVLARPEISFYIISFIALWFIPLIPIIVSSIVGTIIAYFASEFRHSNMVNIIISFALVLLLMFLPLTFGETEAELVQMTEQITEQINSTYPFAQMYSDAVVNFDIVALFAFIVISLGAFIVFSIIVGKAFKNINTLLTTSRQDSNYELSDQVQMSPLKALYRKEIKRYFSSAVYVMNTSFGVVMLTIGAVALIFVDLDKHLGPGGSEMIKAYLPFIISFCIFLSSTTMASISLEGKNLWIARSLPVSTKTIFMSKIGVNLTILAPALLDVIILAIVLDFTLIQGVVIFISTLLSMIFVSLFGLVVNLAYPNLNWNSEVIPVKQSTASFITIFGGMAIALLQGAIFYLIRDYELTYIAFSLLLLVMSFILYKLLGGYGERKFASLT